MYCNTGSALYDTHTNNSYGAKYERIELPSNVVIEKKTLNPDRAPTEKNTKLTTRSEIKKQVLGRHLYLYGCFASDNIDIKTSELFLSLFCTRRKKSLPPFQFLVNIETFV